MVPILASAGHLKARSRRDKLGNDEDQFKRQTRRGRRGEVESVGVGMGVEAAVRAVSKLSDMFGSGTEEGDIEI